MPGFYWQRRRLPPVMSLLGLTIGAAGVGAGTPKIWVFRTKLLTGGEAATSVALISSVGSMGGFLGPAVIGWIRQISARSLDR